MFFEQEFIEWVEENPIEGVVKAGEMALESLDYNQEWTEYEHELLWEASAFINLVLETHEIDIECILPEPTSDLNNNYRALEEYIRGVVNSLKDQAIMIKINSYKNKYNAAFKKSFAYEFSQDDIDRIQQLISELREHITKNTSLAENHKFRLLKRLENLQMELHKRVSDLDRFWGLVGDAGVMLRKFGKDEPMVALIKEITKIISNAQARAEELLSGTQNPMLEDEENT